MSSKRIEHVLIIGAGPIGLLLGSLLQKQGVPVTIFEKRMAITRERRVKLSGQVLRSELIDERIFLFSENQIRERTLAIETIGEELSTMIRRWLDFSTQINEIQESLRTYFHKNLGGDLREGPQYDLSANLDYLQAHPNTLVIDCTGYHSILREKIQPNNRIGKIVEYALICTFILDDRYECNELCKYYKNKNLQEYHVIPSITSTYRKGEKETFVTCIITISDQDYQNLSKEKEITEPYLKVHFPLIYNDLHLFLLNLTSVNLRKVKFETMEFIALPLNLYRSRQLTRSISENELNQHWILMGDAAMGGPYFQSISFGYEAAIYFAYIVGQMRDDIPGMLKKYEDYCDRLWLKLQINSQEIEENKRILRALCRKDFDAILNIIKIY